MKTNSFVIALLFLISFAAAGCAPKDDGGMAAVEPKYTNKETRLLSLAIAHVPPEQLYGQSVEIKNYLSYPDGGFFADQAARDAYEAVLTADHGLRRANDALVAAGDNKEKKNAATQQVEDAGKALEAATKARAGFEARYNGLSEQRIQYIAAIDGSADSAVKKRALADVFLNSQAPSFRAQMQELERVFMELDDPAMNEDDVRARAIAVGVYVPAGATVKEARDEVARAMTRTINSFAGDWSMVSFFVKNDGAKPVEDAISPFIMLKRPEDLGPFKPFEPLKKGEVSQVYQTLANFAARYPDGKIAKEIALGSNSELLKALGTEGSKGLAERDVVRLVVNDLRAAYFHKDMEPVKTFRVAMVGMYSQAAGLSSPDPLALMLCIFGSSVLFGGLAFAIFRAVRSKRLPAVGPTT